MPKKLFEKGRSGNPGGRPKQAFCFTDLARQHSEKALNVLVASLDSSNEKYRIMAADILIERAWGKPIQEVQGNLKIKVTEMPVIRVISGEAEPKELNFKIGTPRTAALAGYTGEATSLN